MSESQSNSLNRRTFLQAAGGVALATALQPRLFAAPTAESTAENAVKRFYQSLSDSQTSTIAFPFNHQLRNKINANWHITKPVIGDDFYTTEQRELIREIVKGITSEDGYERLLKQMEDDDGGLEFYSVAMFGDPQSGPFEWELTGRHLTLRADGNSVDKAAFGGPIVYGHGESDPKDNLYHYQTKQTNEVFKALDPAQAKQALLANAPRENAVETQTEQGKFPGLCVGEMSSDQQDLVKQTMKTLLAPYRQEDIDEVHSMIDAHGGIEKLHMAFYKAGDLNDDQLWDIWRIEGPSLAWHFRGAPHVHAYINITQPVKS